MSLIILLVACVLFSYALINKPEIIAVLLFTLIIAAINFDLPGMPINSRALIALALFGRIIIDKSTQAKYPRFLNITIVRLLLLFQVYIILIAFAQGIFKIDILKENIFNAIASFCVFHFFFKSYNASQLKLAVILSGLICFADLAYTYIVFGTFPIHRIYYQFAGLGAGLSDEDLDAMANWNFFGQICGICFIYVFTDYIKYKPTNRHILWLLPIMFLGVLMSTSRSALLAVVIISLLVIINGINYKEEKKRIYKIATFAVGAVTIGLLLFSVFGKYLNLDSKFLDEIMNRLSQEPIAIVKKALGQSYNIQELGSMDWREESSENAYSAYMNMSFMEQFFGIGVGGFEIRNIGQGYNAHNALLLLLIENGILGLFIYTVLIFATIFQSILKKNISPSLAVVGFILIYGTGQNREWTSICTFLFVFCMVAEIQYLHIKKISMRQKNHFTLSRVKASNS